MSIGLAIGLALDFGGVIGQGDGIGGSDGGGSGIGDAGDVLSSVADAVGGAMDRRGMIQVPWYRVPKALFVLPSVLPTLAMAAAEKSSKSGFGIALYVGPVIDISFLFFTVGGCFGTFGCAAGGGGIKLGPIGIGALVPFWKWW